MRVTPQTVLLCVVLSALLGLMRLSSAVFVFDTDGSLDQLTAMVALLKPPNGTSDSSPASDAIKLVVVSANGRGATHAANALVNVKNVLRAGKSDHIEVVLGEQDPWYPQNTVPAGGNSSTPGPHHACRAADQQRFPSTPFDVAEPRAPTLSGQAWSQYDEDRLFGAADLFLQEGTSRSLVPSMTLDQILAQDTTRKGTAGKVIANKVRNLLADLFADSSRAYERMDYICLSSTSNLAYVLEALPEVYRRRMNVHLAPGVENFNAKIDVPASNYVLAVPNLYRKLYLSESLTTPVQTIGTKQWEVLTLVLPMDAPSVSRSLIQAFREKAAVVEKYLTQHQQPTPNTDGGDKFATSKYGPQVLLAALCAVRGEMKEYLVNQDELAVVAFNNATSGELDVTVLHDAQRHPDATHVFRKPFSKPKEFWTLLEYLLGHNKGWMEGQRG